MRRSFAWWGALMVLACPWGPLAVASVGTAESQAVIRFDRFLLGLEGEMRLVALRLGAIPVATVDPGVADRIPVEESLSARLRWRPSLTWQVPSRVVPVLAVRTEVDLLDGMAFAGPDREVLAPSRASRVRQDLFEADNIRLNAAYLLVHSPYFTFLGGRQKSHAGLGMVATEIADPPTLERRITIFAERERGWFERVEEHHVLHLYDPDAVRAVLERAGFTVAVDARYGPDAPQPPAGWCVFVAHRPS